MRDVWVTVGSFNGDVKDWPFGMLLEGSKSSLGWQPQRLFTCSEVLPSLISTLLMSSNGLGIWRTRPYFLIVERPMIRSKGEESKMIALIQIQNYLFIYLLIKKVDTYYYWFWHIMTCVIKSTTNWEFCSGLKDWLIVISLDYSSGYKVPCQATIIQQALHINSSLTLHLRGES